MEKTPVFTPIDLQTWPHAEQFYYFSRMAPTGYSLTVKLDITDMKAALDAAGIKFYPAYLWLVPTYMMQMTSRNWEVIFRSVSVFPIWAVP